MRALLYSSRPMLAFARAALTNRASHAAGSVHIRCRSAAARHLSASSNSAGIRTSRKSDPAAWPCRVVTTSAPSLAQDESGQHMEVEVDVLLEDEELSGTQVEAHAVLEALRVDAERAVRQALLQQGGPAAGAAELSIVLTSDARMARLNATWRGKQGPTDVLSFPMDEGASAEGFPVRLLGDLIISLDTAQRQAAERGYGLLDECRVLLVHGLLHLLGHDHETGDAEAAAMAAAERQLLRALSWQGEGLISASEATIGEMEASPRQSAGDMDPTTAAAGASRFRVLAAGAEPAEGGPDDAAYRRAAASFRRILESDERMRKMTMSTDESNDELIGMARSMFNGLQALAIDRGLLDPRQADWQPEGGAASTSAPSRQRRQAGTPAAAGKPRKPKPQQRRGDIRLICIDMDGTLLDSSSKVLPSSVAALKAALARGVTVCLATGKARPAAVAAMQAVGLAGEGLVVSDTGPGVFLQGLAVHGRNGALLPGRNLPKTVVREAFEYAQAQGVPLCAFLGDTCVTLRMADELRELHSVYYEPLAQVCPSVEAILAGPPVKKMLFMTDPARVDQELRPHWEAQLTLGRRTQVMQAVPNMLELVPSSVNKWVALEKALLPDLALSPSEVMAIGDGGNDYEMVKNVGLGVAMGNAVPKVTAAAAVSVASNDEGGVAEAIERFVL